MEYLIRLFSTFVCAIVTCNIGLKGVTSHNVSMKTNLSLAQQSLLEKVLYILQKTGGLDYYRIFKILYFSERTYLTKYCRKMVEDDFCALPHGPVPTALYNAIKDRIGVFPLSKALWESIQSAGEDAPTVLLPLRSPNMDYIARHEVETLDEAITTYSTKSFDDLKELSHGDAWRGTSYCQVISSEKIAREGGLDQEELPYLREQLEWQAIEKALY